MQVSSRLIDGPSQPSFHDFNSLDLIFSDSLSPIIVDNTNVKLWEMRSYLTTAKKFDYIVLVIEPNTAWKRDPEKLVCKECWFQLGNVKL
jgi:hypothetical protein